MPLTMTASDATGSSVSKVFKLPTVRHIDRMLEYIKMIEYLLNLFENIDF